jgi:hypothetical protein
MNHLDRIIHAMRAEKIPAQSSGLWTVTKNRITQA